MQSGVLLLTINRNTNKPLEIRIKIFVYFHLFALCLLGSFSIVLIMIFFVHFQSMWWIWLCLPCFSCLHIFQSAWFRKRLWREMLWCRENMKIRCNWPLNCECVSSMHWYFLYINNPYDCLISLVVVKILEWTS